MVNIINAQDFERQIKKLSPSELLVELKTKWQQLKEISGSCTEISVLEQRRLVLRSIVQLKRRYVSLGGVDLPPQNIEKCIFEIKQITKLITRQRERTAMKNTAYDLNH